MALKSQSIGVTQHVIKGINMGYPTAKCIKLVAIVIIAIGLSACSEQKTTQEYIAASKVYVENLEYDAAIIEIKNAVRQAPKNGEVRYYLAQAYIEQGSYLNAEKELNKAEQFGFDMTLLLPELVFIKSKLNKIEEVYALVEDTASLSDEQYMVVLTYAGITALNNKELERAQDFIAQANAISETSLYSQMGKAYLFYVAGDFSKGIELVNVVLGASPDFSEALLLKGHLLFSVEQFIQADQAYSKYRQRHPLANQVRFLEINSLISAGEYEQADIKTAELLIYFKNAPLAHQYKAQIEFNKQNYEGARSHARIAAQQGDKFIIAQMIAGVSSYQLADMEQAYVYLNKLEKYLPSTHPVKKIIAIAKLELGYIDEAERTFDSLEGLTSMDNEFLQHASLRLMKAGEFDAAERLILKAKKLAPNSAPLMVQQGLLLLSKNDLSGIEALERAIEIDPQLSKVELALAIQYLATNEDSKAQNIATKLIESKNKAVSGYLLQGIIHTKHGFDEKAKNSFNKVLLIEPNNIAASYNLAMLLAYKKDYLASITLFENVIKRSPGHLGAIQRLSQLQKEHGGIVNNIDFLKTVHYENVNNINLTIGLAQNYRINNNPAKAIELLKSISDKPNLPASYWITLGDCYLQNSQFGQASEIFAKASTDSPSNYKLQLRYIGMLEIEQKYDKALAKTKLANQKFPDNVRLKMLLTYFELRNNNIENAKKQMEKLVELKVKSPFMDKLAGQLAMKDKNYIEAIKHFASIYEHQANGRNAMSLAQALSYNGQKAEAEKTLENYLEHFADNNIRAMLADLYAATDIDKKNIQYRHILKDSPNNIVVLNNLAWGEYIKGEVEQAKIHIERAYQLNADYLPVIESYGVILAKLEDNKALAILEKAKRKGSLDVYMIISLAEIYINNNKNSEAKALLNLINSDDEKINHKLTTLLNKLG